LWDGKGKFRTGDGEEDATQASEAFDVAVVAAKVKDEAGASGY